MGFEPTTTGITIRDSDQLSYAHRKPSGRSDSGVAPACARARSARIMPGRIGAPDRNRTCNPQLRRLVLYPVELRARAWSEQRASAQVRNPAAPVGAAKYRNRYMVGVEGFEPPTPCSQSRCATRLRYTPMTVTRPGQHRATRLHSGAAPGAALDPKTQSQAGAAQGRRIYALPPLWSMAEGIAVLGAGLIACHDAPLFRVRRFWLDYGCRHH